MDFFNKIIDGLMGQDVVYLSMWSPLPMFFNLLIDSSRNKKNILSPEKNKEEENIFVFRLERKEISGEKKGRRRKFS